MASPQLTTEQPTTNRPQRPTVPSLAETWGRAMGSSLHIAVTGDPRIIDPLLEWAVDRVDQLEERWSRFIPTSEITQLNNQPGVAMVVSNDTMTLVRRSLEARRLSGGRFDPTMLQAMVASGYDRTFVSIKTPMGLPGFDPRSGDLNNISMDSAAGTVTLGPNTGFDPGGIGKGLAADLVAEELVAHGAAGALVNIGGDLRCIGEGPADGAWVIACGDDVADVPTQILELNDGGVASSTRSRRQWKRMTSDGVVDAHHLLDPTTGEPAVDAANLVTAIAGTCADAEWIATALAAEGDLPLDRSWLGDAAVMLTDRTGAYLTAGSPERYLR